MMLACVWWRETTSRTGNHPSHAPCTMHPPPNPRHSDLSIFTPQVLLAHSVLGHAACSAHTKCLTGQAAVRLYTERILCWRHWNEFVSSVFCGYYFWGNKKPWHGYSKMTKKFAGPVVFLFFPFFFKFSVWTKMSKGLERLIGEREQWFAEIEKENIKLTMAELFWF